MLKRTIKSTISLIVAIAVLLSGLGVTTAAVKKVSIASVKNITINTEQGSKFVLPKTVPALMSDKSTMQIAVKWSPLTASTSKIGKYSFGGTVAGYSKKVTLILNVVPGIKSIADLSITINENEKTILPKTVKAVLKDGKRVDMPVVWESISIFKYKGKVEGYKKPFYLTFTIKSSILSIADINITVKSAESIVLPKTVKASMSDGKISDIKVTWTAETIFKYIGTVEGYAKKVLLNITLEKPENKAVTIASIANINLEAKSAESVSLPIIVKAAMSDGTVKDVAVKWEPKDAYNYIGTVEGYKEKVYLKINLVKTIEVINDLKVDVFVGDTYVLPSSVPAKMSDNTSQDVKVVWDNNTVSTADAKSFTYYGKVEGYSRNVVLYLTVISKTLEPAEISKLSGAAVVRVEVTDFNKLAVRSGSGFIIRSSGYIVTNYHVIDMAYYVKVILSDGRKFTVDKIAAYDVKKDIAILKIEESGLPSVNLGDSDLIQNGDKVVAIGSPLGLENTISDGLVSNKARVIDNMTYIQISAPISKGSSGGALFNTKAEVIGITSATIIDGQNINLAIPINHVKAMMNSSLTLKPISNIVSEIYPKLSYNDFSYFLYTNFSSCKAGSSYVLLDDIAVFESSKDSNKLYVIALLDKENYEKFHKGIEENPAENKAAVENLSKIMFNVARENYPEKNIVGAFAYYDTFTSYPSSYDPSEIYYNNDTKMWEIMHTDFIFYSDWNKNIVFEWYW